MLGVAVRAAGYTYMALCSFNTQKSTLLLIWKIINTSKACCSLASCVSPFASSCDILQVEMHSCWNALILNLSSSVNNSWCSLHLKMLVKKVKTSWCTRGIHQLDIQLAKYWSIICGSSSCIAICVYAHTNICSCCYASEVSAHHTVSGKHRASTALLGPWATPPMTKSMLDIWRRAEEQRAVGIGATYSQRLFTGL